MVCANRFTFFTLPGGRLESEWDFLHSVLTLSDKSTVGGGSKHAKEP